MSNVIWCTGYVPDLRWIDLPVLDADGFPIHVRGVVASQPGLYFIGLLFLHSRTSTLIGGVGRDAEHIASHLASRQRRVAGTALTGFPYQEGGSCSVRGRVHRRYAKGLVAADHQV